MMMQKEKMSSDRGADRKRVLSGRSAYRRGQKVREYRRHGWRMRRFVFWFSVIGLAGVLIYGAVVVRRYRQELPSLRARDGLKR